jgi:hypothetical protein
MCKKVISKSWQHPGDIQWHRHLNLTIFSINLLTLNTQPAFSDQPTALAMLKNNRAGLASVFSSFFEGHVLRN